jgi:hypothetical protein
MASSLTELGNLALQAIGEPRVMDINEPQNRAGRELALSWPAVRDEVIESWDWNFSRDQILLPKLAGAPPFKYKYWYQAPADSIKVWSIAIDYKRYGENLNQLEDPYNFGPEFDLQGGKILTNEDITTDLNLVSSPGLPVTYSKVIENVTLYPAYMVPVFYYRWAMAIAEAVTGDQSILGNVSALYEKYFKKARASNAREGVSKRPTSTFLQVRE